MAAEYKFYKHLLNVADPSGRTVLKTALKARRLDLISLLLERPDIDLSSTDGVLNNFLSARL